jgi:hypothetical protein
VPINKKAASVVAVGAAAAVIGLGVSQVARADDAATSAAATTTATSTPGSPDAGATGSTDPGDANGNRKGWGPGGRHGGGMGKGMGMGLGRGANLSALATALGVDQTKLEDALKAVRDELRASRTPGQGKAAKPDPAARQDELATRLAGKLGIPASKVKAAFANLRAARDADEQKAFEDRLARAVKDGKLTQAEADAVKKAVKAGVIDRDGGHR